MFSKSHKTFIFDSSWDVSNNKKFQNMFLDFCENVLEKNKISLDRWLDFRRENIKKNKSKLFLRNKDFLALKL